MSVRAVMSAAAIATMAMAAPAMADVKAGVDAWAKGDYFAAVKEWRPLAIAGDADAQFNLGQAYKLGRGVPLDPALAESWFRKAAVQGHAQAIDNYGLALFQANKKAEALPWLEKSVSRGEPRTQLVLGTMLFNGDGVPKDWIRAYALMTRASASGLPAAQQTLSQMDQYISPDERQKGTVLAQQYQAQAATRPMTPPPVSTVRNTDAPPARPAPPPVRTAQATPAPAPKPSATPAMRPKPAPTATASRDKTPPPAKVAAKPVPKPTPTVTVTAPATGKWRVQLGAFSGQGNAQAQWAKVRGRMNGAQASYVRAGTITRLQAGPYPSKAAAAKACAASGIPCVVVAP
ncbi:sporulation protein [Sphingomonas sp. Leaf17]|uniref:SPOR domain-containing protein n=1 Tax=Sphingomonas sp. Leaf17 TaxID=1735683 RepID=UPI0006F44EA4|nr:SPOR domain-containing protein [Sphingomonas sp. Leaf17]KQM63651.1 sporulation protein [Sphingomonas sp. Leaf17]